LVVNHTYKGKYLFTKKVPDIAPKTDSSWKKWCIAYYKKGGSFFKKAFKNWQQ
jgi:hypothetical protein